MTRINILLMRMVFVASCIGLLGCTTFAQTNNSAVTTIEGFLKNSGRTYRSTGNRTWVIETPKGIMLAAAGDTFVVLGFIIVQKAAVPKTQAGLLKLLALNHTIDFLKVGTDEDGDLFLRTEMPLKLLDQAAFNEMLTNLVNTYDTVKNAVGP